MTTHLDDIAVSAAVDGEASPNDVDHLKRCPDCQLRLAAFKDAAAAVAVPPSPPPPGQADLSVQHALADVFDRDSPPSARQEPTVPARHRRAPWAIATAAAVIAVAAAVIGLAHNARPGRQPPSQSAGSTQSSARPQQAPAAASGAASIGQLGAFSDPGQLTGALRSALGRNQPNLSGPRGSGASAPPPCAVASAQAAGTTTGTPPRLSAALLWQGQPALATVYQNPDGQLTAAVLATPGCKTLLILAL